MPNPKIPTTMYLPPDIKGLGDIIWIREPRAIKRPHKRAEHGRENPADSLSRTGTVGTGHTQATSQQQPAIHTRIHGQQRLGRQS